MIPSEVHTVTDPIVQFAGEHTAIAAFIAAWLTSWVLYGVLGKKYLGADDDYWERIRAVVIPILGRLASSSGLYVQTPMTDNEYAGYASMTEDEVERGLKRAGFLRQPLASMHKNERGWLEDGSWARSHGVVLPVARLLDRLPLGGPIFRRFLASVDTVFAMRQLHVVIYTESTVDPDEPPRVHVYAHDEANPLNPITAFQHYQSIGNRAAPRQASQALASVGIELKRPV